MDPVQYPPVPRIVKLNIGGKRFYTTLATLSSLGDNFFTALIEHNQSQKIQALRDEDGFFFVDRNGRYFEPILDYLRTGKMEFRGLPRQAVLDEMVYYHIPYPSPQAAKDVTAAVQSYLKTTANKTRLEKNPSLAIELRCISEAVINRKSQFAELADWLIARLINFWPLFEQEAKLLAAKGKQVMILLCDGVTVKLDGSEVDLIEAMETLPDTSIYKRTAGIPSQQELVGIADNTLITLDHALRTRYTGLERDRGDSTAYDSDVFHRRLPLSITLRWFPPIPTSNKLLLPVQLQTEPPPRD